MWLAESPLKCSVTRKWLRRNASERDAGRWKRFRLLKCNSNNNNYSIKCINGINNNNSKPLVFRNRLKCAVADDDKKKSNHERILFANAMILRNSSNNNNKNKRIISIQRTVLSTAQCWQSSMRMPNFVKLSGFSSLHQQQTNFFVAIVVIFASFLLLLL